MGSLRAIGPRPAATLMLAALMCGLLFLGGPAARAQTPTTSSGGTTVTYAAGWNLVALPPSTDLSKIKSSLFTIQPGDTDYETIDPKQGTQSGFGYWAYFAASTSMTLSAGSGDFYAVLAPAGQYIMVGNPSGTSTAIVSGADAVNTYDPVAGYGTSPLLNPGQGAWVLSDAGGPITVTITSAPAAAPPSGSQPPAARFYGSVSSNGAATSAGTTVSAAAASGASCGSTTVGAAPATGSNYALDLTGSDPGCSAAGSPLTFSVGGAVTTVSGQSTVPDVSGAVRADLSTP
jgi:hypothetical protein